ncbi:hypothetical protein BgiMline_029264 [Biomphalaria glabrata]
MFHALNTQRELSNEIQSPAITCSSSSYVPRILLERRKRKSGSPNMVSRAVFGNLCFLIEEISKDYLFLTPILITRINK